ncbi:hypothetical protein B4U37_06190 [Sutcliffiella horikoshii]|uniref:Uncharacterized protein n=1 Tax=Sutcliffiella horikoshii TaxID=79883 RepID=A0ABN4ZBF2_9BACI|nr:hypothetical protein B4U37_06190 [Sutcliffiella horikoshii]
MCFFYGEKRWHTEDRSVCHLFVLKSFYNFPKTETMEVSTLPYKQEEYNMGNVYVRLMMYKVASDGG